MDFGPQPGEDPWPTLDQLSRLAGQLPGNRFRGQDLAQFLLETRSYEPIPLTLEPRGISLFPIPDFQYSLSIVEPSDALEVELLETEHPPLAVHRGQHEIFEITEPTVLWIATDAEAHLSREDGKEFQRIWESERPSEIASLLTDAGLLRILAKLRERPDATVPMDEHQFADLIHPVATESGRHDLVLLLREHGLVEKSSGTIRLTDWGRQVLDVYATPQSAS